MNDRYVQAIASLNGGDIPVNDPELAEGMAGHIGMNATQSFMSHLQFRLELPSYDAVVSDPEGTPTPDRADLQMLMVMELAGMTDRSDLARVLQYVARLPQSFAITYVSSLLRRDYKTLLAEPAMQAWISKNAQLVSLVQSLSAT